MGKFEKGKSGNPTGRKKGKQNQTTEGVKLLIAGILKKHWSKAQINADLKAMNPKQRQETLSRLAGFVIPKPTENNVKFDFESLAPEKVTKIYDLIFNQQNDEGNN
jgi:hypothetical protein